MGFPYCLDEDGHYVYEGKFYNSMKELPDEANFISFNKYQISLILYSKYFFT